MKSIVLFGASGHAKVIIDVVERCGDYRIAGLVDSGKTRGETWFGYKILGGESELRELADRYSFEGGIVAIGDNWTRRLVADRVLDQLPGFSFVSAIHPSACLGRGVQVGRGSVIMAGVTINSDTRIGDFCIINTSASIDHDNEVEDYASIGPGAVTGGGVHVGRFSAISIGASVIHGRTIGPHAVIGAGATVIDDIPGNSVAWGTPARVVRSRKPGDRYL